MADIGHIGELVRARTWKDYLGQTELKKRLDIHIEAALNEERKLDHILLAGHPGYGKTTLARIIADRLGESILSFQGPSLNEREFVHQIRSWRIGGLLFIDEFQALPESFQVMLLPALEDGYFTTKKGVEVDVSHITFIGATTDPDKIITPLLDRFTIKPRFAPYSDAELTEIIVNMAVRCNVKLPTTVAEGLAAAARGTPRLAGTLISAARSLASVGNTLDVESILYLAGIDADGLDEDQLEYLRALDTLGGAAGLVNLCSLLQVKSHVVQDLERLLVQREFISYEAQGRVLLHKGRSKITDTTRLTVAQRRSA